MCWHSFWMTDEERKMQKELQFLEEQEVSPVLIGQVEAFRKEYPVHEAVRNRISEPKISF